MGGTLALWVVGAISAIVLLVGAALLFLALRGRKISSNPHCRKCRFDLAGLSLGGDDPRCPECGQQLTHPRAVRQGLRKKRPLLAAVGALLVLAPLAILGVSLASRVRPNIHAWKPDFWLMFEAHTASPASLSAQLSELLARAQGGSLSEPNLTKLIERSLAVQADPNGSWDTAWGDLLEFAASNSLLSDTQLAEVARNAPRWTLSVRPSIVQGDDLIFNVELSNSRVGNGAKGGPSCVFSPRLAAMRIDGREIALGLGETSARMGIHPGGGSAMTSRRSVDLAPGEHEVTTVWEISVLPDYSRPALAKWTEERSAIVKVLPRGSDAIELISAEPLRDEVQKSLALREPITMDAAADHCSFYLHCSGPPAELAFDIFLRERDTPDSQSPREWKLGQVSFTRGGSHSFSGGAPAAGLDVQSVDVILRPSTDAAKGTLSIYSIWNGEVWFQDVPVVQGRQAGSSASSFTSKPLPPAGPPPQ